MRNIFLKILYVLIALALAFPFIPLVPVAAKSDLDPPPTITFHPNACVNFTCPSPDDNPLIAIGNSNTNNTAFNVKTECNGGPCASAYPIYVDILVSVDWVNPYGIAGNLTLTIIARGNKSSNHPDHRAADVNCGGGSSGTCYSHYYVEIPYTEISPTDNLAVDLFTTEFIGGIGGIVVTEHVQIIVSSQPISQCDKLYQIKEPVNDNGNIAATNESGEHETLIVGQKYRLRVYGGPWNDGTTNRYDTAIKIGLAGSWQTLAAFAASNICIGGDPSDPNGLVVIFSSTNIDFYIRVNDTAGAFGNNTGSMSYQIDKAILVTPSDCGKQYMEGTNLLASGTILATNQSGYSVTWNKEPAIGAWLAIDLSGPGWGESGGLTSYDLAVKYDGGAWAALNSVNETSCDTNPSLSQEIIYFQYTDNVALGMYLRVNDTDGIFSDNVGGVFYSIFGANRNRFNTGCELTYKIGQYLGTVTVPAASDSGLQIIPPLNVDTPPFPVASSLNPRSYVIETSGGPWRNGNSSIFSYDGAIANTSNFWYLLQDWPGAYCVTQLDPIGHYRIYFPQQVLEEPFKVRVNGSGSFTSNTGDLEFSAYQAANLQTVIPGTPLTIGACTGSFSHGTNGTPIYFNANDNIGVYLPLMNDATTYAVVTTAGPWLNNATPSYAVALSDDNGSTWSDITQYNLGLCNQLESDTHHTTTYLQGGASKRYKVRVYDPGDNFTDNTGYMGVTVYPVGNLSTPNTWSSCADNYMLQNVNLNPNDATVSANLTTGSQIVNLENGKIYALEINPTPQWLNNGTGSGSNLAQISNDNGSTWSDLKTTSFASCIVQVGDINSTELYRIYFTANGTYRLRVKDDDGYWLDNTGSISYKLYSTSPSLPNCTGSDCPTVINDVVIPSGWAAGCNNACNRPNGVFEFAKITPFSFMGVSISFSIPIPMVGAWLEYARCSLQKFLSVCPEHITVIQGILNRFLTREPFKTIGILSGTYSKASDIINSYNWNNPYSPQSPLGLQAGGETSPFGNIIPLLPTGGSNPWNGGKFEIGGEDITVLQAGYIATCKIALANVFGNANEGACDVLAMIRQLKGLLTWIQILFDVTWIANVIRYIMVRWINPMVI